MTVKSSESTGELLGGLKVFTFSTLIVGSAITFTSDSRKAVRSSPGSSRISRLQVATFGITFVCLLPLIIVKEIVLRRRKLYSRSDVSSLTNSGSFNDSRIFANFERHAGFCRGATSLKNFSTAGNNLIGVSQSKMRLIARTSLFVAEPAIGWEP